MKIAKKLTITALLLLVFGFGLFRMGDFFGGSMPAVYFNQGLHVLSSTVVDGGVTITVNAPDPQYQEKLALDVFESLDLTVNSAGIRINLIPSDGYYLEYCMPGRYRKPVWDVTGNCLTFKDSTEKTTKTNDVPRFIIFGNNGYNYQDNNEYYLNLYVPADMVFDKVQIRTDYNPPLSFDGMTADTLTLTCESTDISLKNVNTEVLTVNSSYGAVTLEDVTGTNTKLMLDSGSLHTQNLKTQTLDISSSYADLNGISVAAKKLLLKTDGGSASFHSLNVDELNSYTEYCDIKLEMTSPLSEYQTDVVTEYSSVYIDHREVSDSFQLSGSTDKKISINAESGEVDLSGK